MKNSLVLTTLLAIDEEVQRLSLKLGSLSKGRVRKEQVFETYLQLAKICCLQNDIICHLLEKDLRSSSSPEDAPIRAFIAARPSCLKEMSDTVPLIPS